MRAACKRVSLPSAAHAHSVSNLRAAMGKRGKDHAMKFSAVSTGRALAVVGAVGAILLGAPSGASAKPASEELPSACTTNVYVRVNNLAFGTIVGEATWNGCRIGADDLICLQ